MINITIYPRGDGWEIAEAKFAGFCYKVAATEGALSAIAADLMADGAEDQPVTAFDINARPLFTHPSLAALAALYAD